MKFEMAVSKLEQCRLTVMMGEVMIGKVDGPWQCV